MVMGKKKITKKKRNKEYFFFYHYTNFVLFSIKTKANRKQIDKQQHRHCPRILNHKKDEVRVVFKGPLWLFRKVTLIRLPQSQSFSFKIFLLRKTTRQCSFVLWSWEWSETLKTYPFHSFAEKFS